MIRDCWCDDIMNSSLALFISGGVSFGVIAALCSGIFYLVVVGLKNSSRLREILDLPSLEYPSSPAAVSTSKALTLVSVQPRKSCNRCYKAAPLRRKCFKCRMKVCRACSYKGFCSTCRIPRDENRKTGDWFYQRLQKEFNLKVAAIANNSDLDGEVREFMERLVETLVGGSLDDVSLTPLSDHPDYDGLCDRHQEILSLTLARLSFGLHMAIANKPLPELESPSTVTSELKTQVQKLTDEALTLPELLDEDFISKSSVNTVNLDGQTYEDILAKAIINKVVEKSQRGQGSPTDSKNNLAMTVSPNFIRKRNKLLSSDSSDMNGTSHYSWSDSAQSDPISLKVEEHIEEVTTRYSSDDEEKSDFDNFLSNLNFLKGQRAPCPELGCDIVDAGAASSSDDDWSENDSTDGLDIVNPVDSWEENWLFQRRRLAKNNSCHQPVPVPMLVPNPALEYRALIGDVDADEMSDLSECSDSVLEQLIDEPSYRSPNTQSAPPETDEIESTTSNFISIEQTVNITMNAKPTESSETTTGNSEKQHEVSEVMTKDSVPNESSNTKKATKLKNSAYSLSRSSHSSSESDDEDSPSGGDIVQAKNENVLLSQHDSEDESIDAEMQQRDSEYTVATVAQTHPVPDSKFGGLKNDVQSSTKSRDEDSSDEGPTPRPGTIAEREHKKWEKAVPLANNPYSKENIDKRLKSNFILSNRANCDTPLEFISEQTIHVGSNLPDMKRYSRDFYINTDEDQNERTSNPESKNPMPERRISQETKTCEGSQQVSVRVEVDVWPAEKIIQHQSTTSPDDSPQVSPIIQTTVNMNKMNGCRQEKEFEVVEKPGVRISSWVDNEKKTDELDECHSLPSVKELAKHFSTGDKNEKNHTIVKPTPVVPAIPKMFEMKHNYPSKQIHSLTARSISREFREGLRCSHNVMRNNVLLPTKPLETSKEDSGHVSDDSGTASPTPTNMPKLHDNIAFWEQMTLNS
ncbi:unnamed protein product [Bemisia tabaci]|uniref:Uncharacterized protein n=1 Tax=Bemisia tabaci TaxID=7038 RepID=A0A9P0CE94_BEMTA|nr:unnamed protein product [Bemisia tabaci]